jgi:FkbH-like protein
MNLTGLELLQLSWLPRRPADFRQQCRAALSDVTGLGIVVEKLASFGHDYNSLVVLNKLIENAKSQKIPLTPLHPFKLAILSNATTDYLAVALTATAARHGLALECIQGNYGQVLQEVMPTASRINLAKPEAILLALDWRGLPLEFPIGNADRARAAVDQSIDYLRNIQAAVRNSSQATCIFQGLVPPSETLLGSMDRLVDGTPRRVIHCLNERLEELVRSSNDVLLDLSSLAATVGYANWHSPAEWNIVKTSVSQDCLPLYAEHVCRLLAAQTGRSRRCLVLDLDNTMWGGVIGDDGLAGIRIGQGDAVGEAYVEFQRYILALRERGVVLAVSSKNEDAVARLPFREHPDMLVREEHLAVFQANWKDKPSNIRAIAEQLNLGLESLVFVDDNPFERELVRQTLPQVAVPEMPEDPAYYAATLSAAGLFEAVQFTEEDRRRAAYYAGNAKRVELQSKGSDLGAYLSSLEMKIVFQPFDESGRKRIVQLINKSNQFNLTTRRYTEADVERFTADSSYFSLQVRLSDVFGDNGMISVVLCRPINENDWEIDLWLMSCRVLGRGVERMVLRELLGNARRRGIRNLIGTYLPTDRNKLVEHHYETQGFSLVERKGNGQTVWTLSTDAEAPESAPMEVQRIGFDSESSYEMSEATG